MRIVRALACLVLILSAPAPASAGPILDRIRAEGVVRCGGVDRPGLVDIEPNGKATGLELDLCRAIASVVLGPKGRLEFRAYDSEKAFGEAQKGSDDVSFLTAREMIDHGLTAKLIAGPTVFIETMSVMVPARSTVQRLADLAGRPICFALLKRAQDHLADWFKTRKLEYIPMGFQEDVEMNDAYTVHYCSGIAGETTTLADTRAIGKAQLAGDRMLPDTLAAYPIVAGSSVTDGEWAAIVAWTIHTLVQADAKGSDWALGGLDSLRIHAPELGLATDWQKQLIALTGTYGDMYERNLGEKSELKMPRGPNLPLAMGGALASPYSE